jgi:hypothetical protein
MVRVELPLAALRLIGGRASTNPLWGISEARPEMLVEVGQVRIPDIKCNIGDALAGQWKPRTRRTRPQSHRLAKARYHAAGPARVSPSDGAMELEQNALRPPQWYSSWHRGRLRALVGGGDEQTHRPGLY